MALDIKELALQRTLDQLGIARRTFYRRYERYLEGGSEALDDRSSAPSRAWSRIGAGIQDQIVEMALEQSELSPRELAVRFTDEKRYFVSEATIYRQECQEFRVGWRVEDQAAMAFVKRSPKMTANCTFAIAHSRCAIFHSLLARFKTRRRSFRAASSAGTCPLGSRVTAQLGVERLDVIRGGEDAPDLGGEGVE